MFCREIDGGNKPLPLSYGFDQVNIDLMWGYLVKPANS